MDLLISNAFANAAPPASANGGMIQIVMLGVFVLIFWLMIWRPQSKRAKEHKKLLSGLTKGDEAITTGGILGKVVKVTDEYITMQVSGGSGEPSVEMHFQKNAVAAVLPKGTIKAIVQNQAK